MAIICIEDMVCSFILFIKKVQRVQKVQKVQRGRYRPGHAFSVRVDGPAGPKVPRVQRIDSGFAAEGCGGGSAAVFSPLP
jgi:hypothetical protein